MEISCCANNLRFFGLDCSIDLMVRARDYFLLLFLACLWGPSFLLIKIAVVQASPLAVATFRILLGSLILLAVLKMRGTEFKLNMELSKKFMISGFVNMSLPYIL